MELQQARAWVKRHWWWVALTVVLVSGYSVGKDLAQRDNQRASTHTGQAI